MVVITAATPTTVTLVTNTDTKELLVLTRLKLSDVELTLTEDIRAGLTAAVNADQWVIGRIIANKADTEVTRNTLMQLNALALYVTEAYTMSHFDLAAVCVQLPYVGASEPDREFDGYVRLAASMVFMVDAVNKLTQSARDKEAPISVSIYDQLVQAMDDVRIAIMKSVRDQITLRVTDQQRETVIEKIKQYSTVHQKAIERAERIIEDHKRQDAAYGGVLQSFVTGFNSK